MEQIVSFIVSYQVWMLIALVCVLSISNVIYAVSSKSEIKKRRILQVKLNQTNDLLYDKRSVEMDETVRFYANETNHLRNIYEAKVKRLTDELHTVKDENRKFAVMQAYADMSKAKEIYRFLCGK